MWHCDAQQEQEDGSDEGEGAATGLGQGQGREDVSEEIENEGQLEGLQVVVGFF